MKILLARHGETPWNAEGRYQGQVDIPLSEVRIAHMSNQARELMEKMRDLADDRFMSVDYSGFYKKSEHNQIVEQMLVAGTTATRDVVRKDSKRRRASAAENN